MGIISAMRFLLGLVLVVLALAAGGVFIVAGRMAGPAIEIGKPEKFVGAATPLDVGRRRARAQSSGRCDRLRAERQADAALHAGRRRTAPSVKQDGADKIRVTRDDRQAGKCRTSRTGPRADRRDRGAAGALRHPERRVDGDARRAGPARAAARVGDLDAPLHQPRRVRDGRLSRHAGRRRVGRPRRRHRVSGLPGVRRRRSKASASPTRRCASRSSRCCYDQDLKTPIRAVRARRGGQHARAPTSTTACSRSRSRRAASSSTTGSSTASSRPSSRARPR